MQHAVRSDVGPDDRRRLLADAVAPVARLLDAARPGEPEVARLGLSAAWAKAYLELKAGRAADAAASFRQLDAALGTADAGTAAPFRPLCDVGLAASEVKAGSAVADDAVERLVAAVAGQADGGRWQAAAGEVVLDAVEAHLKAGRTDRAVRLAEAFAALPDGPTVDHYPAAVARADILLALGATRWNGEDRAGGAARLREAVRLAES